MVFFNFSYSEQSIASARASVMVYDDVNKKWIPSGSSSGLSKVHIYQHTAQQTFRVVGRKLQDHEVGFIDNGVTQTVRKQFSCLHKISNVGLCRRLIAKSDISWMARPCDLLYSFCFVTYRISLLIISRIVQNYFRVFVVCTVARKRVNLKL